MKTKDEILKDLLSTLAELQSGTVEEGSNLESYLRGRLSTLDNILGDDVPEEWWNQIGEWI